MGPRLDFSAIAAHKLDFVVDGGVVVRLFPRGVLVVDFARPRGGITGIRVGRVGIVLHGKGFKESKKVLWGIWGSLEQDGKSHGSERRVCVIALRWCCVVRDMAKRRDGTGDLLWDAG